MNLPTIMTIGTIVLGVGTVLVATYALRLALRPEPGPPRPMLAYYDVVKHASVIVQQAWTEEVR